VAGDRPQAKSMNALGTRGLFARVAFDVAELGMRLFWPSRDRPRFLRTTTFDPTPHSTAPRRRHFRLEQSTCMDSPLLKRFDGVDELECHFKPATDRRRKRRRTTSIARPFGFSTFFPNRVLSRSASPGLMVRSWITNTLVAFPRPHVVFFKIKRS